MSDNHRRIVVYVGPVDGFEAVQEVCPSHIEARHVEATTAEVRRALAEADALVDASMRVPLTDVMIGETTRLRVISCATTGSDHISRQAADRRGVRIRTLREDPDLLWGLTPAAEHSWGLLMACARQLVPAVRNVLDGEWVRERFPGLMLRRRQLGLVGCGRIGQWMARYANAFDMSVAGFDPYLEEWPQTIRRAALETIVENSDFISLHVHLTSETRGLLSRDLFERMKPGVIVINTSRGGVLDETALLDGLQNGRIGAAGLDVVQGEPDIAEHPLVEYARQHSNLLITPHIGGFSPDAIRIVARRAMEKALSDLQNEEA